MPAIGLLAMAGAEGSYESGSVLLSVLLFVSFLGIGSLVFSETLYGVRDPYGDLQDLEKSPPSKNDQKWSKMPLKWFFLTYQENLFTSLSGNGVELKYLWPFNILQKLYMWEKFGSQVMAKNALGQSNFSIL